MHKRLPRSLDKRKICIICEGYEEYEYLEKLESLGVWFHEKYEFHLINAKSNGNIPARYQEKYQMDSYDVVLIFCDTDGNPYEQYDQIKRKINEFHGNDIAAKEVVIFGNPCTMQIIILHWEGRELSSHNKKKNAPIIEELLGINGYKAKEEQRVDLFSKITKENYGLMKERIKELDNNDKNIPSSNFVKFINYFHDEKISWIKEINDKLESEG